MEKAFIIYLESIDITEILHKKIEAIFEFYTKTTQVEITDIFVTDYLLEDGTRVYKDLWLFSSRYWLEATDFTIEDRFDIRTVKNRISRWEIQKQDYDFIKATEKSKLALTVRFDTGMYSTFNALKGNCDYLKNIILKYIMPNLKE